MFNEKYRKILLFSYMNVIITLFIRSYIPIYWQIGRFFSVLSGFSILFVSGYWITNFLKVNEEEDLKKDSKLGINLFNISLILAAGLTLSTLTVVSSILLIGFFSNELFYIFLLVITLIYLPSLKDIEWRNSIKNRNLEWINQVKNKVILKFNPNFIIIVIGVIIWFFGCTLDPILIYRIGLNRIQIQMFSFLLIFFASIYSIRSKNNWTTLISIFLLLLFTRICIYQEEFIIGSDSTTHYERFLQISENPQVMFDLVPINLFAPITYSWMIFLNIYGNDYIIPFSFILLSCFAYMCIYALGIKLTSFKIASIGLLFSTIEFTTFQFGFEIRTFTIALMYIALWAHSLFEFKERKQNQVIHMLLLALIGLSHITSFLIILLIEGCLSLFFLIEKLNDVLFQGTIILSKFPITTQLILFLSPIFLILSFSFYYSNESIKWIIDVLLNRNPIYYISFDLNRIPGLSSAIYGPIGMIIIWLSRISFMIVILFAFVIHPKNLTRFTKYLRILIEDPLSRLLIYIVFSLSLIFFITLFIPEVLSPSRIYVLLVLPMGFLLGLSEKSLNKKTNYYTGIICFLFLLNTLIRFPNYFKMV
ncbi:MAG: hypothetical protein ACFFB5_00685 [Promethearchaeota archaeon]